MTDRRGGRLAVPAECRDAVEAAPHSSNVTPGREDQGDRETSRLPPYTPIANAGQLPLVGAALETDVLDFKARLDARARSFASGQALIDAVSAKFEPDNGSIGGRSR